MDWCGTERHAPRPRGWLRAELDAQLLLVHPDNAEEVLRLVAEQISGISHAALRSAPFEAYPAAVGGSPLRLELPFAFTPATVELLSRTERILDRMKLLPPPAVQTPAGVAVAPGGSS